MRYENLDVFKRLRMQSKKGIVFGRPCLSAIRVYEEWIEGYGGRSAQYIGSQHSDTHFTGAQSAYLTSQPVNLRFLEGTIKDKPHL